MFVRSVVALSITLLASGATLFAGQSVLTVIGAGGEDEFRKQFEQWGSHWEKAAKAGEAAFLSVGTEPNGTNDITQLQEALAKLSREGEPLWLVLLGHGTFDGKEAKFNLRGPDVSAADLAKWLQPFTRPLVIINTASSSAPFLNALSRSNRVIITATRSGHEENFARLGKYLSETIGSAAADLDKDGQTSLLEAFVSAARQTTDFYKTEGRLATEHALLDDNGDGLGTQADWFRGVRAVKKPEKGGIDGLRAHQLHLVRNEQERKLAEEVRKRRDEIELAISKLRESKATVKEEEYYRQLEPLLVEMARLYESGNSDGQTD
jgi:hypothetical protein